MLLNVYPGKFDGGGVVPGDRFKHRFHVPARTRPLGPKLDEHGLRGIEHFPVKVRFIQFNDVVHSCFLFYVGAEVPVRDENANGF